MTGAAVIQSLVEAGAIVCQDCDDSGWVRFECTGGADCGRRRRHLPHTYARPCPCRAMNPAYNEKQYGTRQHHRS